LSINPYNWQKTKKCGRNMSTFFNNLDWAAAKSFGLEPVINPPPRRCDLPSKFVTVNYDGTFLFCCFDFMRLSVDKFGNINNGLQDFIKHWLGKYMQSTRDLLNSKNRADHEYCSMCKFTSIRCDIPYWKAGFEQYWDGEKWNKRKLCEPIISKPTYKKNSVKNKKKSLFSI
jgi:radical SAM protein with 4Fe4S-binding SPASM domain